MKIKSMPSAYTAYLEKVEGIGAVTGQEIIVTPEAYEDYIMRMKKNKEILVEAEKRIKELEQPGKRIKGVVIHCDANSRNHNRRKKTPSLYYLINGKKKFGSK